MRGEENEDDAMEVENEEADAMNVEYMPYDDVC